MDWKNDMAKEVLNRVSNEPTALSHESYDSMASMKNVIGAQSANSLAALDKSFGKLVLVNDMDMEKLPPAEHMVKLGSASQPSFSFRSFPSSFNSSRSSIGRMNETQAHAEFNSFGNSFGRINDYFGSQVGRSQEQTQQSNVIAVLGKLVRLLQDLLPPQPAHASGLSGLFRQQFQAQQQLPPYSPLGNLFNNFGDRQAEQAAPFTTPLGRLVNQVSEKQGQQTAPFTTPLGRLVKQVSEKQGQQTAPFTTPLGRLVNQINDAEPLNPQPLPPVDLFNKKLGALEPLNPQPLPPVDLFNKKLGALDPLNPQPLPPVDLFNKKFGAIEPLNPQPLPPVDLYNKGLASVEPLNPQPLPPIDLFKTNGPLNRELFAFQTNQNDIINKSQILRAGERSLEQFQIQTIMSDYNNAETLSSSVQKKSNDTVSGIISKI